jgi:hypothetical protein
MSTQRIRIWQSQNDKLTLTGSALTQQHSRPWRLVEDLHGLGHRLESGERAWPVQLELELWPWQLSIANADTAALRLCAADWLERAHKLRQELVIFADWSGLATDDITISHALAWRCVLTELPSALSTDLGFQQDNGLPLLCRFHVTEDGSFSNFDSVGTYLAASPARPWTE